MISKEGLLKAGGTILVVLAALAIHQKFIAPMIAGKPKASGGPIADKAKK